MNVRVKMKSYVKEKIVSKFILLVVFVLIAPKGLPAKTAQIYPKHPRIFLRAEEWEGGISIDELRKRIQLGDWMIAWKRIRNGSAQERGIPTAAIGYLINEDEERAKKVIARLKKKAQTALKSATIWDKYEVLHDLSIGFDWVYNSPSFSKSDKKELINVMGILAEKMIKYLNSDHHIFSRAMEQVSSVGMVGLAIWSHHPKADKFIKFANDKIENVFDALQYLDGAWAEGFGYLNQIRLPYLLEYLEAYKSATQPSFNYFKEIEERQHGWLRKMLYFHIYNLRPDDTWVRFGDISLKAYPKDNFVQNLEIITTEYKDSFGSDFLLKLEMAIRPDPVYYRGYLFKYLLFHEPNIPIFPGVDELPLEEIFGKDSLGYINIRSGWADDDVFFRYNCGDYFTGHQHSDQGNFTIFKYAPLVIDSGYYAKWGSPHRQNYFRRTIAHNTLLIYQPGEKFQSPYKIDILNDGGQRTVWYHNRSAQQRSFTLKEHLSRNKSRAHYETGDIKYFEASNSYVYIDSDVTAAYNNPDFSAEDNKPKLSKFRRQIVTLKPEYYFIMYDTVFSLNPEYKKIWLLHTVNEPEIIEAEPVSESIGFKVFDGGTLRVDNGKGRLYVKTLYPVKHKITLVGGEGYDFFVDGYNQEQGVPLKLAEYIEPGAWRIEVEPILEKKDDIFLNVLYPCDSNVEQMPDTERIDVDGGFGVQVKERVVVFSSNKQKISYNAGLGTIKHLICGLAPKSEYSLTRGAIKEKLISSDSGVIEFTTETQAIENIIIEKL